MVPVERKSSGKEDGLGDQSRLESPEKTSSPRSEKRKRQRERTKALLKEAKAAKSVKKDHLKNEVKVNKDKRIPDSEWKSISETKVSGQKRCHYYNSSMGCSMGDKCRFKHACMVCGSAHPMVGNH